MSKKNRKTNSTSVVADQAETVSAEILKENPVTENLPENVVEITEVTIEGIEQLNNLPAETGAEVPVTEKTRKSKSKPKMKSSADDQPVEPKTRKNRVAKVDEAGNPICGHCHQAKPESEFGHSKDGKRRNYCRDCDNEASKASRAKHPKQKVQIEGVTPAEPVVIETKEMVDEQPADSQITADQPTE